MGSGESSPSKKTSVFPRSIISHLREVWDSTVKIPYWWRSYTEIHLLSLIGCYLRAEIQNRAELRHQYNYSGIPISRAREIGIPLYAIIRVESETYFERGKNWARKEGCMFGQTMENQFGIELKHGRFWATDGKRKSSVLFFGVYCHLFFRNANCKC